MQDFGLYIVVTNPALGHRRFTEICVEEELEMIQLREKKLTDNVLLEIAKDMRAITKGSKTRFVINDRADLAMLCEADGLHLGQDDLPWREIRSHWKGILGVSTHNMNQALDVQNSPQLPDYMSFGPIYPTVAKEIPDPAVGTKLLSEILKIQRCPILAIGGIFVDNLDKITGCGAKNVAMIRQFCELTDESELRDKIRYVSQALKEEK
jgi:thiamine-phosphate pyrophosphorylase